MTEAVQEKAMSPIRFGDYWFEDKADCLYEGKRRITKYKRGDILSKHDTKFFESLFTLHYDYLEKVGCGIKHLRFDKDSKYGTNCIIIVRRDDTEVDISWANSLQRPKARHDIQAAFRQAVEEDVVLFRSAMIQRGARCWLTNEILTDNDCRATYSTDLTFNELVEEFLDIVDINIYNVKLMRPRRKYSRKPPVLILKNPVFKRMWQVYHREMAQIVLVSTKEAVKVNNRSLADIIAELNKTR